MFNRFVMANETGSFLQSWEWGQWQERLGRKAYRFWVTDNRELITSNDNNNIIAAIQFIKMPLPFGKYYLYCPYGPVVKENFQFPISNFQFLLQELQKRFPSAIFFRIEPKIDI